jgi:hypothetical protein
METNFKDPIELKLHLLDKYGVSDEPKTIDFCREAYKFLVDGDFIKYMGVDANGNHVIERVPPTADGAVMEVQPKDGVYLIYEQSENGQMKRWCELFTGNNNKDCAVAVAFKFGQVSLILYGQNIEDCKMTCKDKEPISVIMSYDEAACDFMGRKRTQDLVARGLSCVDKLPESKYWYIPAIGELYVMYLMKNQINKALKYIGAELIKDTWYWSSTEVSDTYAWFLSFYDGALSSNAKTDERSVRPVSAFNPLTL